MIERSTNIRSNIEQLYARNNIVPNIVFEVRECNSAIQYVALGFGVSIMPWVPAMETNRIKIIPISERDRGIRAHRLPHLSQNAPPFALGAGGVRLHH